MPLSDVVDVQITASTAGLTLPGFGTPLVLGGYNKAWAERVRYYADPVSLSGDFPAGTPEYIAGSAIFAQTPRPMQIAIGRGQNKPTPHWTITPVASIPQQVTTFTVKIGARSYSFVSDPTPTAAEVVAGLTPLINVDTATHGLTASGTNSLALVGAAGSWQSVSVGDVKLLRIVQDHVDPGVAPDLDAIRLDNDNWYALINPWNSSAMLLSTAAWVEANKKLYLAGSQETQIIDTSNSTATDVAMQVMTNAYKRTAVVYSPSNADFLDAAEMGRMLPEDPGSETWALKTLAGVPATTFTGTHLANLRAKNCGWYYSVAGRNITQQGKVGDAEFIDTIRFLDWLQVDIQSRVFLAVANAKKIPYTDVGAAIIQTQVKASLAAGEAVGGLVPGQSVVTVPPVAKQNPSDKANRHMPGVVFTGVLQGAIHDVVIRGTVTA